MSAALGLLPPPSALILWVVWGKGTLAEAEDGVGMFFPEPALARLNSWSSVANCCCSLFCLLMFSLKLVSIKTSAKVHKQLYFSNYISFFQLYALSSFSWFESIHRGWKWRLGKYLPQKYAVSGIRKEIGWTEHSLVKVCIGLCEITHWSHLACFWFCYCSQYSGHRRNCAENGGICSLQEVGIYRRVMGCDTLVNIRMQLTQPLINAIYCCVGILTWDLSWLLLERTDTNGTDSFWLIKLTLFNLELQCFHCNKTMKIIFLSFKPGSVMHGWNEETGKWLKTFLDVSALQIFQNYLFQWRFKLPVWLLVICEIEWHLVPVSWTSCQEPHLKVITTFLFLYGIFQCSVLVSNISPGWFSWVFWVFFWTAGMECLSNL